MFGFIAETAGKVFGTDKAVKSLIDNVSSGLDKMVYTDEEKAEDAAKTVTEARQMLIEWMRSTQGQNLARRIIALGVTGVWLAQFVIAWLFELAAVFTNDEGSITASKLTEAATVTAQRGESMIGAVMLILGFYFAAPHMGQIATAAINRFTKDQTKTDRVG